MRPLSSVHPVFYRLSVGLRRLARRLRWAFDGKRYAAVKRTEGFENSVVEHSSLLLRKLAGTDPELQRNKVDSLRVACSQVNSVLVRPGEVFSFWRLVGKPAAARGFPPGLQLSFGNLVSMEGGGLCQLSNLLHWMVLHTPLKVTERHRHSTDPFPDHRRKVPFGSGATVFYNYLDLSFFNPTRHTFQIIVSVGEEYLKGRILSDEPLEHEYRVFERAHRFVRRGENVFRENQLWRTVVDRASGTALKEELLMSNSCRVFYEVPAEDIDHEEEQ